MYVPKTPTRAGGRDSGKTTQIARPQSIESFIDPFVEEEPKEPLEELRDVVVRIAREQRSDMDRSVFIIGDEWDSRSDEDSFEELRL